MRHNYYDIASNPQMVGNRGPASAWKFSGTEYLIEDANQRELWLVNKPSTVIAWGAFVDYTYQNYPKFCTLKSDSGDNESWQLGISAQVGYEGIIFGSSSTWARCKTGTTFVQTTYTNHVVVVVYNGGTASSSSSFRVWHNGREATIASASMFGATSDYTRIGSDGSNYWYGQIGLVAVVHRAYSAYEARQVCHDPLAMFRPRKSLYKGYAPAGKGTRWQVSSASTGRRYWELKP